MVDDLGRSEEGRAAVCALQHGGRLRAASARYGIALEQWLDLSTGINPVGWRVGVLSSTAWMRLPEDDDGLEAAARDYYGAASLLPVAGSQAAIQALPSLRAPCRVTVIQPGYAEHAHAWRSAGHSVIPAAADAIAGAVAHSDVLVLIHPNNPTGARFNAAQLLYWRDQLAARGGWLVVDEAFMDATPEESLASFSHLPGLVVLRSLGKFFGLAGARVGFVLAAPPLLAQLAERLGPWSVAGPSRAVATAALRDHAWQLQTREQLFSNGARLAALLCANGLTPSGGTPLFQWVCTDRAATLHERLARRGVLTRLFDAPASVRFGLPDSEAQWEQLEKALAHTMEDPQCAC
jgi:cobalamin biosynthetic protein CobC